MPLGANARSFSALSAMALCAGALFAQADGAAPAGVAWDVSGTWYVDGRSAPIADGSAIEPGALLRADAKPGGHSMSVLLPDGQRVLNQCTNVQDCARGFRVPELLATPDPVAVKLFAGIRAAFRREDSGATVIEEGRATPRDEAVAVLDGENRVRIGGLVAHLPNGRYTCDVRPLDGAHPREPQVEVEKDSPELGLTLPSPGLYGVNIRDSMNRPRIHLFVAAVTAAQAESVTKPYDQAKSLLKRLDLSYYYWPVHEFQRAYLEWLMLDGTSREEASAPAASAPGAMPIHSGAQAAEPAFNPKPGLLKGANEIAMRSATPGAKVHYTIDGSEPLNSSPVFASPILIKATGITVKAYASAPGKKDSAVVTAYFQVRQ